MTKFISAQKILDEKGFRRTKFDTSAFLDVVKDFFQKNDVSAELTLIPYRFVLVNKNNDFNLTDEDIKRGFLPQCERNEFDELKWAVQLMKEDYEMFHIQCRKNLVRPRVIIDKPFIQNAAFLLQTMGGFVVEKTRLGKFSCYSVTLV